MRIQLGHELQMMPVAPEYVRVRYIHNAIFAVFTLFIPLAVAIIVAITGNSLVWNIILWTLVVLSVSVNVVNVLLIRRQVAALGYAELPDELAIRKGIMFQSLVLVPYGRMQQVNIQTGPILRKYGLASVELVTASSQTNAKLPGVTFEEAQRLREKLTALGNAQMEGL